MEYTVFRNLKHHRLLKNLEEVHIHEKRRKYDNKAIENDFVRSYLVTKTVIINSKTLRKTPSEAVVQTCNFIKKETLAQVFSCEFC